MKKVSVLAISLSKTSTETVDEDIWFEVKQEPIEDEEAKPEEVAEVLDTVFDLDPCTVENPVPLEQSVSTEEDPNGIWSLSGTSIWSFNDKSKEVVNPEHCELLENGCTVYLLISRSHPEIPYEIYLEEGEIGTATIVSETREETASVDNSSGYSTEFPIVGNSLVINPTTNIHINGQLVDVPEGKIEVQQTVSPAGINFDYNITGTFDVQYTTTYDRVPITLPFDENGEPKEIMVRVTYAGMIQELQLEYPELDPSVNVNSCLDNVSSDTKVKIKTDRGSTGCYNMVETVYKCECSGDKHHTVTSKEIALCPEGVEGEQVGTRVRYVYINCGEDSYISGKALNSSELYEDLCCTKKAPYILPRCKETKFEYTGGKEIENGAKYWRNLYGADTILTPAETASGRCGELTIEIDVDPLNCCDEVPPIVYDDESNPELLPAGQYITLYVSGGLGVYEWKSTNKETRWQGSSDNKVVTNVPYAVLWATENFCGQSLISVTDGCSEVQAYIRSDIGRWEEVAILGYLDVLESEFKDKIPDSNAMCYDTCYTEEPYGDSPAYPRWFIKQVGGWLFYEMMLATSGGYQGRMPGVQILFNGNCDETAPTYSDLCGGPTSLAGTGCFKVGYDGSWSSQTLRCAASKIPDANDPRWPRNTYLFPPAFGSQYQGRVPYIAVDGDINYGDDGSVIPTDTRHAWLAGGGSISVNSCGASCNYWGSSFGQSYAYYHACPVNVGKLYRWVC